MPEEVRLWQVRDGDQLREVSALKLDLESRLETWLAQDISILSSDLLVIGRQVETEYRGYIDLLCINSAGDLVIVELKRDRTAREIAAQVLDYASWVRDLSHREITQLADAYLKDAGPLEEYFTRAFGIGFPETLNTGHEMIVVGSQIDDSTERIVGYLSDEYGVSINAATFTFYQDRELGELIARVFLIEPETVDYKARTKGASKRRPNLTYDELERIASKNGVLYMYERLVRGLQERFYSAPLRECISFQADIDDRKRLAVFNLVPQDSSRLRGLRFRIYALRFERLTGLTHDELLTVLPEEREEWQYYQDAPPDLTGYAGYFRRTEEIEKFLSAILPEDAV